MTAQTSPQVGSIAPDFTLPDSNRESTSLDQLCARSPCVLVFYRGHW